MNWRPKQWEFIPPDTKYRPFVLAAFYAGIAGSFYAHFVKYISPDSFYIYESFILLAMLAFGGQGNLIGPVVGAARVDHHTGNISLSAGIPHAGLWRCLDHDDAGASDRACWVAGITV